MPSFEHSIASAPAGFVQGCVSLNDLAAGDEAVLSELLNKCLKEADYVPKSDESEHKNIIKVLNYIIRASRQSTPLPTAPQMATALDSNTFLNRSTVEKIIIEIQSFTSNAENESKATQTTGQLSNFQWRIGVAACSSKCNSLYSPYVSISFDVSEPNGQKSHHTAELTHEQFKEFLGTFDKVAKTMDSN